jgi:hypothetical protein
MTKALSLLDNNIFTAPAVPVEKEDIL